MASGGHLPPSMTCDVMAVSWRDIGGYGKVKERLQQALEWPVQHAGAFKRLGLHAPRGVLLYGPPGVSIQPEV